MNLNDLRNRDYYNFVNDNYYLCVYDLNDNFVCDFDDFKTPCQVFNITTSQLFRQLRSKTKTINYNGRTLKLYLFKKTKIDENYKRCIR